MMSSSASLVVRRRRAVIALCATEPYASPWLALPSSPTGT